MRKCVFAAICLALLLQGCKSLEKPSQPLTLNSTDLKLAEALAHFSQGMIYRQELGALSKDSLKSLINSAQTDTVHGRDEILSYITAYCILSRFDFKDLKEEKSTAASLFSEAVAGNTDNPWHYICLARIHFDEANDEEALRILSSGLSIKSCRKTIRSWTKHQANDFVFEKEYVRAAACFAAILDEEAKGYRKSCFILGELYEMLGQEKKALKYFTLASEGGKPVSEAFMKIAYLKKNRAPKDAVKVLLKAAEKFPDDPKILFYLGYLYGMQSKTDKAIEIYEKMPEVTSRNKNLRLTPEYFLTYGATCEQAGMYDKAEDIFEEGIKNYPESHEMLNYLAYMWAEQNRKLDKALDYVNSALIMKPDNGAYIDTLGWILYRTEKYEEALKEIIRADKLIKNDPTIKDHLGDIYIKLDKTDKAVEFWKESFIIDPENKKVADKLSSQGVNIKKLRSESKARKAAEASKEAEASKPD